MERVELTQKELKIIVSCLLERYQNEFEPQVKSLLKKLRDHTDIKRVLL